MKKQLLLAVSCAILLLASCSKDKTDAAPADNTPATSGIPADGWKLGGTTYKQVMTVRQEEQFVVNALDAISNPNTFAVSFKAYPAASGKYKVVGFTPDADRPYPYMHLNDGEIIVVSTTANSGGNNTTYYSIGTDNKEATVTVTNGKFKIEIPEILVTSGNNDTLKASVFYYAHENQFNSCYVIS